METTYDAELEVSLDLYYAYDPDLEVELELSATNELEAPTDVVRAITPEEIARDHILGRRAAATIALAPAALDDAWFGTFDETQPVDYDDFDDQPTTTWRRISDWLLRRAA